MNEYARLLDSPENPTCERTSSITGHMLVLTEMPTTVLKSKHQSMRGHRLRPHSQEKRTFTACSGQFSIVSVSVPLCWYKQTRMSMAHMIIYIYTYENMYSIHFNAH